jgi:transposase
MKAYSQDLRECVLRAVDQRYPRIEIVQFLGISLSTLKRYLRTTTLGADMCARKQFLVVPRKNGHNVLPQLQAHDDATLEQHCDFWEQTHGERVRSFPMSRAIKRLGWTRKKKSLGATERNEEERATWRANASKLPTESLVVIDETGSNIALTPLYARAPKGERKRRKCATQSTQEYHPHRRAFSGRHGSRADPGRISQHHRF